MITLSKNLLNILKFFKIYNSLKNFYKKYLPHAGITKGNIESVLFKKSLESKNNTFFDIGSFEGGKIDIILNIKKNTNIIAFEPFKKYFKFLKKKFRNYKNIQILNYAISNVNKKKNFYYNKVEIDKEAFSLIKSKKLNKKYKINCIKLDNFLKHAPGIIKIDTEGSELMVLEGSKKIIKNVRPILFIETTQHTLFKIKKKLDNYNYKIFIYEFNFFKKNLKNNWINENVIKNDYFNNKIYTISELKKKFAFKYFMFNIICIPKEYTKYFRDYI